MTDSEIFVNATDDLTRVKLAAYFDEACGGGDEELKAGIEAFFVAADPTWRAPSFAEIDEKPNE